MAKREKERAGYDVYFLLGSMLLLGIGLVMVYSASSAVALKKYGNGAYFFRKQAVFALAAVAALIICRHMPYRFYKWMAYPGLALGLLALISIYLPGVGREVGGAKRWVRVLGFSFQPSEFARLALIVYLAYSMSKKQDRIKEFAIGFLPHVLVVGIFATLIVMQPDFGAATILVLVAFTMLFVAGVRLPHLLSGLVVLMPVAYCLLVHAEYRLKRLTGFLDPWRYQSDEGYQIVHSLMAMGSGGITGSGIGNSYQKLFYLPAPHTDFIFSVIGEELGLIGVCLVIGLYALIVWRGIVVVMKTRDLFSIYLGVGLLSVLGLQVCVNVGVAMGLLPPKGLTLPLVSYGGTSLVVNAAAIGILMKISAREAA